MARNIVETWHCRRRNGKGMVVIGTLLHRGIVIPLTLSSGANVRCNGGIRCSRAKPGGLMNGEVGGDEPLLAGWIVRNGGVSGPGLPAGQRQPRHCLGELCKPHTAFSGSLASPDRQDQLGCRLHEPSSSNPQARSRLFATLAVANTGPCHHRPLPREARRKRPP